MLASVSQTFWKRNCRMKTIVILRSQSIPEDSRVTKWIGELVRLGYTVKALGWDRMDKYNASETLDVNGTSVDIKYFKQPCTFGGGMKNLKKMISFQRWLKGELNSLNGDIIIHACDYDTGRVAGKICKRKGFKLVYDIFDFYTDSHHLPFPLNVIVRHKEIRLINSADATVICTEQRQAQIVGSKPKKLVVIHNTPTFNVSNYENKINDRLKVCFIGSLGYDRLILEIMEEIKNHPQYDFVFGGLGAYAEECKRLAETLPNVAYLGSMPYSQVLDVEKDCDVLFATYNPVIKNHKYSAPNKFYEAGCLIKPIIVCKDTGIDEIVAQYGTGLIIDYSAKDFFDKLDQLNADRNLLRRLGENGHKAYNEHFSWKIMAKKIKELYENL